ncbi:MBL fold metallo-hydrolase [Chitinophaga nivalis]|uniref:MBL fold metallo-hydrolase n=1 Tax=Chitinophaga nivalis TaxID=2991709 RepID=A0ABT3IKC0_9BACT|nr:MBL fold metallo-hydrolase [Chitinophaga nivalis]MCW3465903.1 MBL fold metallo-hydrolase [Chitinophaga nivalis]MCW3484406.1 MBL fold metallo-hydrolase [Chitinophaga nivalis]
MKIKTFQVSYFVIKNQCYLIYKNGMGILIDPAWDYELINDFMVSQQIVLKGVLLTHAHIDHTNLAERFAIAHDVPVFMSGQEIDYYGFDCGNLRRINHLQEEVIGDFEIIPIVTPGHTFGSCCYLIDRHLFSGDTIFIEGVGICDGKGADASKMYDSVQLLKHFLPEHTLFWPGHSYGQTPGKDLRYLLINNIYFQFDNRAHFVNFRMRKGQSHLFGFT